jgi:hypothetical protein
VPAGELLLEAIEGHFFVDTYLIAAFVTHNDENCHRVHAHSDFLPCELRPVQRTGRVARAPAAIYRDWNVSNKHVAAGDAKSAQL